MKIAVVGAGIAGLTCALLLHREHDLVLFEREPRLGGHAHTVHATHEDRRIPVDTGFIVYNERNYPGFSRLLARLSVATQPAPMTFSVSRADADDSASPTLPRGFEFAGTPLGLFAQPQALLSRGYWRILRDIRRLGREGKALLTALPAEATIADIVSAGRFSPEFLEWYLLPMAGAIWSAPPEGLLRFPARFFLSFFDNHGMLDLRERPRWRTITGGSREYVSRLVAPYLHRCRLGCPVATIRREADAVTIESAIGREHFDHVILACHSDQVLAMLADARRVERDILSAMPFQPSDTVLHSDARALPRRRAAWAGWNYRLPGTHSARLAGTRSGRGPVVTYNMTILQSLRTRVPLCVTLNDSEAIDPARVLGRFEYHHPQYTLTGVAARTRWREISGLAQRTHYCGAYWFNGFHEDGVQSALRVCRDFGASL